jgi:hypothetical protein
MMRNGPPNNSSPTLPLFVPLSTRPGLTREQVHRIIDEALALVNEDGFMDEEAEDTANCQPSQRASPRSGQSGQPPQ